MRKSVSGVFNIGFQSLGATVTLNGELQMVGKRIKFDNGEREY